MKEMKSMKKFIIDTSNNPAQKQIENTAQRLNDQAAQMPKNTLSRFIKKTRSKEGQYSAIAEAKSATSDLKKEIKASKSISAKIKAVFGFLFHVIHILFRTIWRLLVLTAVILIVTLLIGMLGLGYLYFTSASELPNIEDYTKVSMPQDSTIYDIDGKVIGIIATVSRDAVGFGEISQPMKDAIIAIEDERFYNHSGIDFQGIARALYVNFKEWRNSGGVSQGASTITQQYVRNAYEQVGTQQTISRKLTEMILAAQLEANMSKDDILNSYLNTIYFGNGCYGVEAASKYYFGHSASTLDYYESAILAAVVNGPSIYNPTTEDGKKETSERANLVLDKMYALGKLGDMAQEDLRGLKSTSLEDTLHITETDRVINQPFYYDYVMGELGDAYDKEAVESGGWQIYTTLSIEDGKKAAEVVEAIEKRYAGKGITGAIADIDIETGAVHSFCGGIDYQASQFDIATQGHLQTGSTLKPIVYAGLCEYDGYYMSDRMDASPVNIGTADNPHMITPYIKGGSGTLKQGIVASDNAMTIHVAETAGMEEVQDICRAVGIRTEIEDNVVTTIGGQTKGLTPLELASGYSTIARAGKKIDYWCISQITDGLGNLVYKHENEEGEYAMSEEVSLQVIDAMKSAVDSAGWYHIPYDKQGWTIAAKTGTTNDDMDSWCVGFNKNRSVALWVGGRDAKVTVSNSSYNTTSSFSSYFEKVGQKDIKEDWEKPQYKTLVPDMKEGQTLEEYMNFVQERQLTISIEYVSAENASSGDVIGVSNAGKLIARGDAAIIQVARDMVAVPDFKGMNPSSVYSKANGLNVIFNVKYSNSGSSTPTVTSQSIKAGELVTEGTSITIEITVLLNSGSNDIIQEQVPVFGTDSALSMLEGERDSLRKKNGDISDELEELKSRKETSNENNSKIIVPNVVGLSPEFAKQVLTSIGFDILYEGDSSDTITKQSPSAGSSVTLDSVITLISASSPINSNTNSNLDKLLNRNNNTNSNSNNRR